MLIKSPRPRRSSGNICSSNDQKSVSGPVAVVVLGQGIGARSNVIDTINVILKRFRLQIQTNQSSHFWIVANCTTVQVKS
jgi:hypothetical protein